MKVLLLVVGIPLLLVLIVGGSYVSSRNEMVRKNETVKQTWSQVDVVLQRRADLIPNLVATVKGYAQQEQKVFGDIANARAGLLNARTPADENRRQWPVGRRPRQAAGHCRELPQSEIQPEFPGPPGRTGGNRKPYRRRAPAVQRGHPGLQHLHRPVPQ